MNDQLSAASAFPELSITVEPGIEPYWQGAARNRLVLSKCVEDGAVVWPPRQFCPHHMTSAIRWEDVAGGGSVYSHTTVHRGEGPFADVAPYVLAYVELDEGGRILTNVVTSEGRCPSSLEIGQRATARFDLIGNAPPVLRFVLPSKV